MGDCRNISITLIDYQALVKSKRVSVNVEGCVLNDNPLASALLQHDQVSTKMYFLTDQTFGPASSVGDRISRLLPNGGNLLQHAALIKCDL